MNPDDPLRAALHRAAASHTPDRAAMLGRITAARTGSAPRTRAMRLAAAVLAVGGVLGVVGVARYAVVGHRPSPVVPIPVMPSPSTSSAGSAPSSRAAVPPVSAPPVSARPTSTPRTPTRPVPSPPASAPPGPAPASRVRGHPGDTKVEKGSLWSDGSVDPASTGSSTRSVVTLKAAAQLTALDLTVRIAVTPGLTPLDATSTVPGGRITATVTRRPDAVLYRFVLRTGAALPPGSYAFTARYARPAAGRDAGGDTYEAFASDVRHERPHVYGNFYPTR